jgi:aromatic ring-opening dioxygenase catalytic subunit (LigB family)
MGELVWAGAVSHTAGMRRIREFDGETEGMERVFDCWEELRQSLAAAEPDALVIVGSDHFHTFSYDFMPVFAIGRGSSFRSWGEFGSRRATSPGHAALADNLHVGLVDAGFDVAGVADMRVDHGYACPLEFLDPDLQIPIVPLGITSFIPPMPPMGRCIELGEALGKLIEEQDVAERVAIVGTGGISHWIGVPETGQVGEEFDRRFLELFERADLEALAALTDEEMIAEGGRGTGELRCWLVSLAAAGSHGARRLTYLPSKGWITGIALLEVARS